MWRKNIGSSLLFGYRYADYWDFYNVGELSVALGGASNLIRGSNSGIIAGENNFNYGADSFIGGGSMHMIDSGTYSAQGTGIVGGTGGLATGDASFIAGGSDNSVDRTGSAIIGGANNIAIGTGSVVLGGVDNLASGHYSGILGGIGNIASGNYSFAGGNFANAAGRGSFVWADSQSAEFRSSINDEFKIRAQGGFVLYSTSTAPTIVVSSGAVMISTSATAASAVPNIFISSVNGNVGIGTMNPAATLDVNGSAQFGSGTTKSTFTATGLLKLTSAGIQWADGSTSTTAASGGGGSSVVFVSSISSALITSTATIPADDSIPQNTEGVQVLEATITPRATTNKLLIRAVINASHTSSGYKIVLALFQDSTANALAASVQNDGSPERIQNIVLTHVMDAGTTSATTFKIRTGAQPAGTLTVNGEGGSRLYGGALKSSLTITEIVP